MSQIDFSNHSIDAKTSKARRSDYGNTQGEGNERNCSPFHTIHDLQDSYNALLKGKRDGEFVDDDTVFSKAYAIGERLHKMGKREEALDYYGQALRVKNKTIDTEPTRIKSMVSDILFCVGEIHMMSSTDDRVRCIQAFDFCIDLRNRCFGPSHPSVAYALYKLAAIYFSMGEKEYSLSLLVETVSILLSNGIDRKLQGEVWNTISKVQLSLGRYDEAQSSYQEALHALKE